jgi:hypothetical protein
MKPHPSVAIMVKNIEAFCKDHGIAPSRFGRMALNDGNFLRAMKQGVRTPTVYTMSKVYEFITNYIPPKEAYNEQTPIKAGDRAGKRRPPGGSRKRRTRNAPRADRGPGRPD